MRRRLELVGVFVNPTLDEVAHAVEEHRADPRAAARRRGAGVLQRRRPAHRRARDQGARRRLGRRHPRRWSASTPTCTCSTRPVRAAAAAAPGQRGTGRLAAQRHSQIAADPVRRPDAGERRRGDRRRAAVGRRRGFGRGVRAGRQGPRQGRGLHGPSRAAGRGAVVSAPRSSIASGPTAASTCPRR